MNHKVRLATLVGLVIALPFMAMASPGPDIEVLPLAHDFGDVELGDTSPTIITVQNTSVIQHEILNLFAAQMTSASDPDFVITVNPAPVTLQPGESADIEVIFSPSDLGYQTAQLQIVSNDPVQGLITVDLGGVGVDTSPEPLTLSDILAFFDESVEAGTLEGRGCWDRLAALRLRAERRLLVVAGQLIEGGYMGWACFILERAYVRADGHCRPPDFVVGPARAELAEMILQFMADMGCD